MHDDYFSAPIYRANERILRPRGKRDRDPLESRNFKGLEGNFGKGRLASFVRPLRP